MYGSVTLNIRYVVQPSTRFQKVFITPKRCPPSPSPGRHISLPSLWIYLFRVLKIIGAA